MLDPLLHHFETHPNFLRLWLFALGAVLGSFCTVAIHRWPQEASVIAPPSHCPSCGKVLRWYDNVPIFGWLWRRGKAACCGAPISARYILVELICAVLLMAAGEHTLIGQGPAQAGSWLAFASLSVLLLGLVVATFVDLEWMEIPDEVSLGGGALILVLAGLQPDIDHVDRLLGAGLGFLVVQVPFVWLYEALRGRRGMGEGDSKLLFFIGAALGVKAPIFALTVGALHGLIVTVVMRFVGPQSRAEPQLPLPLADDAASPWLGSKVPFGPFLAIAAIEYAFFGEAVLDWYFGLLTP